MTELGSRLHAEPTADRQTPDTRIIVGELLGALGDSYFMEAGVMPTVITPRLGELVFKIVEFKKKGIHGSRKSVLGAKPVFSLVGDYSRGRATQERVDEAASHFYPMQLDGWFEGDRKTMSVEGHIEIPQAAQAILEREGLRKFYDRTTYEFSGVTSQEADPAAFFKGPLPSDFYDR